ncbi:MAG: hypothetical protein ABIJ15_07415 [bacterium]
MKKEKGGIVCILKMMLPSGDARSLASGDAHVRKFALGSLRAREKSLAHTAPLAKNCSLQNSPIRQASFSCKSGRITLHGDAYIKEFEGLL